MRCRSTQLSTSSSFVASVDCMQPNNIISSDLLCSMETSVECKIFPLLSMNQSSLVIVSLLPTDIMESNSLRPMYALAVVHSTLRKARKKTRSNILAQLDFWMMRGDIGNFAYTRTSFDWMEPNAYIVCTAAASSKYM